MVLAYALSARSTGDSAGNTEHRQIDVIACMRYGTMMLLFLRSSILSLLGSCLTVELLISTILSRVVLDGLTMSLNCEFASLNCFSRYFAFLPNCSKSSAIVFSILTLSLSSVSLSLIMNLHVSPRLVCNGMTDIFPTPLYNFTSESSFGIALISLIVRFRIFLSFSFDWIWARTRDKARWDATAWKR